MLCFCGPAAASDGQPVKTVTHGRCACALTLQPVVCNNAAIGDVQHAVNIATGHVLLHHTHSSLSMYTVADAVVRILCAVSCNQSAVLYLCRPLQCSAQAKHGMSAELSGQAQP